MKLPRGVTLIELMTAIVILGILVAFAIPSYRRVLTRSQRSEAKAALMQLQTAQEKHYLRNKVYTDKVTVATATTTPGLGLPSTSENGMYDISIIVLSADGQSYTAVAAPHAGGGQADDSDCKNFTINERGVRGNSGPLASEKCWK